MAIQKISDKEKILDVLSKLREDDVKTMKGEYVRSKSIQKQINPRIVRKSTNTAKQKLFNTVFLFNKQKQSEQANSIDNQAKQKLFNTVFLFNKQKQSEQANSIDNQAKQKLFNTTNIKPKIKNEVVINKTLSGLLTKTTKNITSTITKKFQTPPEDNPFIGYFEEQSKKPDNAFKYLFTGSKTLLSTLTDVFEVGWEIVKILVNSALVIVNIFRLRFLSVLGGIFKILTSATKIVFGIFKTIGKIAFGAINFVKSGVTGLVNVIKNIGGRSKKGIGAALALLATNHQVMYLLGYASGLMFKTIKNWIVKYTISPIKNAVKKFNSYSEIFSENENRISKLRFHLTSAARYAGMAHNTLNGEDIGKINSLNPIVFLDEIAKLMTGQMSLDDNPSDAFGGNSAVLREDGPIFKTLSFIESIAKNFVGLAGATVAAGAFKMANRVIRPIVTAALAALIPGAGALLTPIFMVALSMLAATAGYYITKSFVSDDELPDDVSIEKSRAALEAYSPENQKKISEFQNLILNGDPASAAEFQKKYNELDNLDTEQQQKTPFTQIAAGQGGGGSKKGAVNLPSSNTTTSSSSSSEQVQNISAPASGGGGGGSSRPPVPSNNTKPPSAENNIAEAAVNDFEKNSNDISSSSSNMENTINQEISKTKSENKPPEALNKYLNTPNTQLANKEKVDSLPEQISSGESSTSNNNRSTTSSPSTSSPSTSPSPDQVSNSAKDATPTKEKEEEKEKEKEEEENKGIDKKRKTSTSVVSNVANDLKNATPKFVSTTKNTEKPGISYDLDNDKDYQQSMEALQNNKGIKYVKHKDGTVTAEVSKDKQDIVKTAQDIADFNVFRTAAQYDLANVENVTNIPKKYGNTVGDYEIPTWPVAEYFGNVIYNSTISKLSFANFKEINETYNKYLQSEDSSEPLDPLTIYLPRAIVNNTIQSNPKKYLDEKQPTKYTYNNILADGLKQLDKENGYSMNNTLNSIRATRSAINTTPITPGMAKIWQNLSNTPIFNTDDKSGYNKSITKYKNVANKFLTVLQLKNRVNNTLMSAVLGDVSDGVFNSSTINLFKSGDEISNFINTSETAIAYKTIKTKLQEDANAIRGNINQIQTQEKTEQVDENVSTQLNNLVSEITNLAVTAITNKNSDDRRKASGFEAGFNDTVNGGSRSSNISDESQPANIVSSTPASYAPPADIITNNISNIVESSNQPATDEQTQIINEIVEIGDDSVITTDEEPKLKKLAKIIGLFDNNLLNLLIGLIRRGKLKNNESGKKVLTQIIENKNSPEKLVEIFKDDVEISALLEVLIPIIYEEEDDENDKVREQFENDSFIQF